MRGALTGFWPQGFMGDFTGATGFSFVADELSAFGLFFADGFVGGAEEPTLAVAVECTESCLGRLRMGFSVLTVEVPAWLDGTSEERSRFLHFFMGSGSEGPIISTFRSLASLAEKDPP